MKIIGLQPGNSLWRSEQRQRSRAKLMSDFVELDIHLEHKQCEKKSMWKSNINMNIKHHCWIMNFLVEVVLLICYGFKRVIKVM